METTTKTLELIVPVTDNLGNEVEIRLKNLEAGEQITGLDTLCFSFMELRYKNDPTRAYGSRMLFERELTLKEMADIADAYKDEIDKHRF